MHIEQQRSSIEFSESVITIHACMDDINEEDGDPIFSTADRPFSPSHLNIRLSVEDMQRIVCARSFIAATPGVLDVAIQASDFDFMDEAGQDSFGRKYFGEHLLVAEDGAWLVWHDSNLRTRFEANIESLPCFSSAQ